MSAALYAQESPTAPVVAVETTRPVPSPENGAQRCIRRPGSRYTACRCQPCTVSNRRARKLREAGLLRDDRAKAEEQLRKWHRLGWRSSTIASATGIYTTTAVELLAALDTGQPLQLHHATAHAILTAGEPTAGEVSAVGSRRRLQALSCIGYGLQRLAAETGLSPMAISKIRGGQDAVFVTTAKTIATQYRRLALRDGGGPKVRAQSKAKGWASPMQWEGDIDDPDTRPLPRRLRADERTDHDEDPADEEYASRTDPQVLETVDLLVAAGLTDREIGYRIDLSTSGVQRLRIRHGIRRNA